jgi:hypothetical protein
MAESVAGPVRRWQCQRTGNMGAIYWGENKEMGTHLTSLVIRFNEATVLVEIQGYEGRSLHEVP